MTTSENTNSYWENSYNFRTTNFRAYLGGCYCNILQLFSEGLRNASLFSKEAVGKGGKGAEVKVFLKISQNSLENTSPRASFLIKLQAVYNDKFQKQPFTAGKSNFSKISENL